jgi:hypothetical protein
VGAIADVHGVPAAIDGSAVDDVPSAGAPIVTDIMQSSLANAFGIDAPETDSASVELQPPDAGRAHRDVPELEVFHDDSAFGRPSDDASPEGALAPPQNGYGGDNGADVEAVEDGVPGSAVLDDGDGMEEVPLVGTPTVKSSFGTDFRGDGSQLELDVAPPALDGVGNDVPFEPAQPDVIEPSIATGFVEEAVPAAIAHNHDESGEEGLEPSDDGRLFGPSDDDGPGVRSEPGGAVSPFAGHVPEPFGSEDDKSKSESDRRALHSDAPDAPAEPDGGPVEPPTEVVESDLIDADVAPVDGELSPSEPLADVPQSFLDDGSQDGLFVPSDSDRGFF